MSHRGCPEKPRIYFLNGWWRTTPMPRGIAKGRRGSREPWKLANDFTRRLNWSPEAQAKRAAWSRRKAQAYKQRIMESFERMRLQ